MTSPVILVGGFLDAGKTTLLLATAQRLTTQGFGVGLVTNDQGENLVEPSLCDAAGLSLWRCRTVVSAVVTRIW